MYHCCRSSEWPFVKHKAYKEHVEIWRAGFYYRKTCRGLVEAWRVRFDDRKACKMYIDVLSKRVSFFEKLG